MILFLFSIAVSCLLIALAQGDLSCSEICAPREKHLRAPQRAEFYGAAEPRRSKEHIFPFRPVCRPPARGRAVLTDTEFNAVKAFLSAYRYTELDLRVRRAEITRLEALILEGNTDLLFHLEHAICAAKDAIRVLCTRQAEIEAAIDTVESAALREILTQHYICALDLKEIAERMHYSDRHMRRLHRKAIESVSLSAVSPFKKRGSSPRTLPLVKRI